LKNEGLKQFLNKLRSTCSVSVIVVRRTIYYLLELLETLVPVAPESVSIYWLTRFITEGNSVSERKTGNGSTGKNDGDISCRL
jgi:hypothetical protein